MKRLFLISLLVPVMSIAQDCKNYYFMTGNSTIEMTIYDKKGKEGGKQTWTINDVKKTGNNYQSSVTSLFVDEKGKEIAKGSGVYQCEGGVLKADIRMLMPQQQMEQYKDATAKMEPVYIEYPAKPTVGQTLSDADFKMEVESQGGLKTTITFKATNRKVDSKETVTTPAGTWEAFVISYDSQFKIQLGPIGPAVNMSVKEWFVPNFGIVKSETYSKGDKLVGSSQLTAVKK